jgi:hypothetical protein
VKAALAGFVVVVVALVVAFVLVVRSDRDTTPEAVRGCLSDLGLERIIGTTNLGPAATDIQSGHLIARERVNLDNGQQATIFSPPQRDYSLVAITRHHQPPAAVLHRVASHPETLVLLVEPRTAALQRAARACLLERSAGPAQPAPSSHSRSDV